MTSLQYEQVSRTFSTNKVNSRKRRSDDVTIGVAKKRRSNSAGKERDRLHVFNQALETLQSVIPVRLTEQRNLHKKQTLQLAIRYINFLRGCLDGTRDWKERNRFWCRTQDEMVIDAIDQAAAGHNVHCDVTSPQMTSPESESPPPPSGCYTQINYETVQPSIMNHNQDCSPQLRHWNEESQYCDVTYSLETTSIQNPQNYDQLYSQYDPTTSFLTSYFQNNSIRQDDVTYLNKESDELFTSLTDDVSTSIDDITPTFPYSNMPMNNVFNEFITSPENLLRHPDSPDSGYYSLV
uniref:BHLH domain-containing protein n=1 Tax=Ciona intestinalis TaxID=7719 RepID=H2XX80_CIOIN